MKPFNPLLKLFPINYPGVRVSKRAAEIFSNKKLTRKIMDAFINQKDWSDNKPMVVTHNNKSIIIARANPFNL